MYGDDIHHPREKDMLRAIEQTTKRKMDRMKEPTLDEAIEGQQQVTVDRLRHNH